MSYCLRMLLFIMVRKAWQKKHKVTITLHPGEKQKARTGDTLLYLIWSSSSLNNQMKIQDKTPSLTYSEMCFHRDSKSIKLVDK